MLNDEAIKQRILVVFPHFGFGGVEKVLEFVANTVVDYGYETYALSMDEEHGKPYVRFDNRIKKKHIPLPRGVIRKICYLLKLRSYIHELKPDAIIVFRPDIVRILVISTFMMRIPIISSERGNPLAHTKAQKRKYENALEKCEKVVFQTDFAKNCYSLKVRERAVVIPNPCTIMNIVNYDWNKAEKVIVSCGRLSIEKNFIGLIKAFIICADRIPEYKLRIYGDGPEKSKLEAIIKESGNERISIEAATENVFEIERNARLFVLNSFTEGMPNVLIEAMSYGIPCISTRCLGGGVEFLSDNNRRVRLVPVDDSNALADEIVFVLNNDGVAKNLSKNAMEIRHQLNPETIKGKWLRLLEETI